MARSFCACVLPPFYTLPALFNSTLPTLHLASILLHLHHLLLVLWQARVFSSSRSLICQAQPAAAAAAAAAAAVAYHIGPA
jgi:hypothetical protein